MVLKKNQKQATMEKLAGKGIKSINKKSTLLMARKFTKDFNHSIILITNDG
jgi:predicted secreted acid phosphatase